MTEFQMGMLVGGLVFASGAVVVYLADLIPTLSGVRLRRELREKEASDRRRGAYLKEIQEDHLRASEKQVELAERLKRANKR